MGESWLVSADFLLKILSAIEPRTQSKIQPDGNACELKLCYDEALLAICMKLQAGMCHGDEQRDSILNRTSEAKAPRSKQLHFKHNKLLYDRKMLSSCTAQIAELWGNLGVEK